MIEENVSLLKLNTFGLSCTARYFISAGSESESKKAIREAGGMKTHLLVLGGGSNLLFTDDFSGIVLHPEIKGIDIEEENSDSVLISAGAGVMWDDLVIWCVEHGYGGLENLSYIPGMVGAAPVQNIGAYGAEIKDVVEKVRAISLEDGSIREFTRKECSFRYRSSIFKTILKGKYLVTKVFFRLSARPVFNLTYGTLASEVRALGGPSLANVRSAVVGIRKSKLPDPAVIGNAGSFFKNPVVGFSKAELLKRGYPEIPTYHDESGGVKLAAGWLIEKCGWRGKRTGNTGVHEKQALVLVNYGGATGKEIYNLSEEIRHSVKRKFEVELEREVEVIGSI